MRKRLLKKTNLIVGRRRAVEIKPEKIRTISKRRQVHDPSVQEIQLRELLQILERRHIRDRGVGQIDLGEAGKIRQGLDVHNLGL